jgi:hypothetical protein
MKHVILIGVTLFGFSFHADARIGAAELAEMVKGADLIGVGDVVELKQLEGVRSPKSGKPGKFAKVRFVDMWKGKEPTEVWVRAFGTWTCDTTYAKVGERAVFFLTNKAKSPWDMDDSGRSLFSDLPYFVIDHSGDAGDMETTKTEDQSNQGIGIVRSVRLDDLRRGVFKIQSKQEAEKKAYERIASNMKFERGFGAQLFLTEDPGQFGDSTVAEAVKLDSLKKAHRNKTIYAIILFMDPGMGPHPDQLANVMWDITVRKSDGSMCVQQKNLVGWKSKYDMLPHSRQRAKGWVEFEIDSEDPAGTYTVETIVRDDVKQIKLSLKNSFEVPK